MNPPLPPRRPLRILAIQSFYRPEEAGIGYYSAGMCEWLAARGHSVHAIAPPPYFPQWRIWAGYSAWRYGVECRNGVRVRRCPIWVPSRPGGVKRLLHNASFAVSSIPAWMAELGWRPEVVLVTIPALFNAPAALALGRACGALTWLHVQDLELDLAAGLRQLALGPGRRLALGIERAILRGFDVVSSISAPMLNRLREKGTPAAKLVLWPNWVDAAEFDPPADGRNGYRRELGLGEEDVLCLFSGSLGAKQGVELILAAAAGLAGEKKIRFVICGEGPEKRMLLERGGSLANLRFLPLQPRSRLPALLAAADIHLLTQRPEAADLVLPSKLLGMLASGRPVVATAREGTAVHDLVFHRGVCVPPADATAFLQAIVGLAMRPALRQQLGSAGREYALTHFHKERVLEEFQSQLQRRVAGRTLREPERELPAAPEPGRWRRVRGGFPLRTDHKAP